MKVWMASMGMGVGGAERLVAALARGLDARGHAVAVSGPPGPLDAELPPGTVRLALPERGRSPLGAMQATRRLAAAFRRHRPDVVHAHNVRPAAVAGIAARLAGGRERPPVAATFHGVRDEEYAAAARLLRAADAVACVSQDLAAGLEAHGFPAARLRVIPNLAPDPPEVPPELRRELGEGPVVAAVGRLVAQKNHARLLDAIALVPGARLVIAGDGPLRGELEQRARALGLEERVRFLGLRLDAPAIIAAADLLVFSSDWEGQSIAALEALASGTPVVSTPVQGMAELLGTGGGLVAASMRPEDLAASLREALAAPERRAAMGAAGRAHVADRHALGAVLDAYEALYAVSGRRG